MGDTARDGFARQAAIMLRVAGATDITYDADGFCLRFTRHDGEPWVANLVNVFDQWGTAPHAEKIEGLRRFVGTLNSVPTGYESWADVAGSLLPVLNAVGFAQHDEVARRLSREFQPFVHEMVVVDRPDSMAYVSPGHLAHWNVTAAQVFDRARANLAARAYAPPGDLSERDTIFRMPETGSDYWLSHLLVDGWLAGVGERLGARPVVFAADRTGLTIVADAPDVVGSLLEMTEKEYMSAAKPVSTQAYTVDDAGRVVPYAVGRDHPLWNAVHRSELAMAVRQYGVQRDANGDSGEGYLSDLMIKEEPDGRMWSVAVWGENVVTLLPRADHVAVITAAHDVSTVPWEDFLRITGVERRPGWDPPRWLAATWPTELQLGSLRAAAVRP